jgi:hypothetical protein
MADNEDDAIEVFGRMMTVNELAAKLQEGKTRFDLPKFWPDAPVRQAAIDLYRKATLNKTAAALRERFGDRAPSASSLNRFWLRLDSLHGRKQR